MSCSQELHNFDITVANSNRTHIIIAVVCTKKFSNKIKQLNN